MITYNYKTTSSQQVKQVEVISYDEKYDPLTADMNNDNVDIHQRHLISYTMRPWTYFINKKDEKLLKSVRKYILDRGNENFANRNRRLMHTIHQLYQEYFFVCETYLPKCYSQNNSTLLASSNFEPHDFTTPTTDTKFPNKIKQPLLRNIFQLSPFKRKPSLQEVYDKIQRYGKKPIEVYVNKASRNITIHQILIPFRDSSGSDDKVKEKLFPMPIALELLLPKVQQQIEKIMCACSFLCDPLEVVAELRAFNYDDNACINHFQSSRDIRDIIEEFMPRDGDQSFESATTVSKDEFNISDITLEDPFRNPKVNIFNKEYDRHSTVKQWITEEEKRQSEHGDYYIRDENSIQTIHRKNSIEVTQKVIEKVDKDRLNDFINATLSELNYLRLTKVDLEKDIFEIRTKFNKLHNLVKLQLGKAVTKMTDNRITDVQRTKMIILSRQVEELKVKLKEEEKKRRTIYNILQENLGNIRVYCRCRDVKNFESVVDFRTTNTLVIKSYPVENFSFEHVFSAQTSQEELYEEFVPLVNSFIDGYNVSFITYGGEASGKTYTLIGGEPTDQKDFGLMQRSLCTILKEEETRSRDWEHTLTAVAVEIYNETYIDIIADAPVHLYMDKGLDTVFQQLKSVSIESEPDIEVLLAMCRSQRRVAKTALNPASSRSHLVCIVRLLAKSRIHGEQIRSFFSFVDLAGFEDIIKAETHCNKTLRQEASFINRSLTGFNRVFVALQKQDPNKVSYRDTKLTHFLKPFLTNSSKCSLIVTVRTDRNSVGSTQSSLRFGRETRGVNLGRARRQVSISKYAI